MRDGFTLLELSVALTLVAVGIGLVLPPIQGVRARLAVTGAREAVAALFVRARSEALLRGRASVWAAESPPRVLLEVLGDTLQVVDLEGSFGVGLNLSGSRSEAEMAFDGRGLGRMASQTLHFHKGGATVRLVISSYGRVSRP
jgi:prepilin-type N-terminal cleavage/methylation domain-containing protein